MEFPSVDLVVQREQLPALTGVAALKNSIYRCLSNLNGRPKHWIEFDAYRIPDEELALVVSDLVLQGWQAEIKKRFSFFHYYSGFPKPTWIRVRG